jgi:hypothetical protein
MENRLSSGLEPDWPSREVGEAHTDRGMPFLANDHGALDNGRARVVDAVEQCLEVSMLADSQHSQKTTAFRHFDELYREKQQSHRPLIESSCSWNSAAAACRG